MASTKFTRPAAPREYTGVPTLERQFTRQATAFGATAAFPDTQGNIVTVTFTAGAGLTQDAAHKLGRPYQGWYVVRTLSTPGTPPLAASIFEAATQPAPASLIRLTSNNVGIYQLRVF